MQNLSQIENTINNFLQRDIDFVLDNKSIKSGKLVLFSIKSFYFTFTLQINNKLVLFELPYPFELKSYKNTVQFNYHSDKLMINNLEAQCRSLLCTPKKTHKYLNNSIILKEKN